MTYENWRYDQQMGYETPDIFGDFDYKLGTICNEMQYLEDMLAAYDAMEPVGEPNNSSF